MLSMKEICRKDNMERDPITNDVVMSRSELGECLNLVNQTLNSLGIFFNPRARHVLSFIRDIENEPLARISPLEDGRVSLNRRAAGMILERLFVDNAFCDFAFEEPDLSEDDCQLLADAQNRTAELHITLSELLRDDSSA